MSDIHAVTGAFGYTGRYITSRLLKEGIKVRAVTNSPERADDLEGLVEAHPYDFDDPDKLARSLSGASVLYNNYWVRFNHRDFTFKDAVKNTKTLFSAAKKAGVRRIVHISITNPSLDSPFEYFRGKAELEKALMESGMSYAILRPAVLFGGEDILINNIAWMLRRFPVFCVFGDGSYKLQPIHVDELAKLAVEEGKNAEDHIVDAIGPETYTYRELIETLCKGMGIKRRIISVPPILGHAAGFLIGRMLKDVVITKDEIRGLMAGLLNTDSKPYGDVRLSEWIRPRASSIGKRYRNELMRRYDRTSPYEKL